MKVSAFLCAVLLLAPLVSAETVLLDFTASWCGPCRQMEPIVAGLEREGYRVERVDVDRDRARKQQFNIQNVPTFVAVRDGKEVGRVVGAVPADRLRKLLGPVAARPAAAKAAQHSAPPPAQSQQTEKPSAESDTRHLALIQRSVRITVDEPKSRSFGTGTIIRSVPGETLILTCSHLFEGISRDAKATIEFYDGSKPKLTSELVARDRDSDIALIRVATDQVFATAPVANRQFKPAAGQPTVSVGCDNGQPPSIRQMHITAVNRYLGAPTIECTSQPAQGRSGGGLFNPSGELIGVCSAAEPKEKRGIYGGLAAVHTLLDRQGLASIYNPSSGDSRVVAASGRDKAPVTSVTLPSPEEMGLRVDEGLSISANLDAAELVCVIRPRENVDAPARVIAIHRPSPELLAQLEKEEKAQAATRASTSMRLVARPDLRPVLTEPAAELPALPDSSADKWKAVAPKRSPADERSAPGGSTSNRATHGSSAAKASAQAKATPRTPIQESAKWQESWMPGTSSPDSVGLR